MKELPRILALFLLGISLTGCARKPYSAYKDTYKTAGAEKFDDKSVTAAQANKKNIKNMNLAESRAARRHFENANEMELIEKTLNQIMKLSDNYQEKADCLYELATIQLAQGRLEKAREMFAQLMREYPGVAFKKEAAYRHMLAHYWDCSDAQHDQDMTEKTLKLVQEFEAEFPNQPEYQESLDTIKDYCYKMLFDGEVLRMDFYLSKYEVTLEKETLVSARMRLGYILEKLIEQQKQFDSTTKDKLLEYYLLSKEAEEDAEPLLQALDILAGKK